VNGKVSDLTEELEAIPPQPDAMMTVLQKMELEPIAPITYSSHAERIKQLEKWARALVQYFRWVQSEDVVDRLDSLGHIDGLGALAPWCWKEEDYA
jgi:hypothetical protein